MLGDYRTGSSCASVEDRQSSLSSTKAVRADARDTLASVEDAPSPPRFAPWLTVGVIWLVGAIPIGVWAAMFVHAVRVSHFLGRWPRHDNPDPKALPLQLQSERVGSSVGAAAVALVIALGILTTRPFRWRVRLGAAVLGGMLFWAGWFVISRVDPGGVVAWYLD